MSLQAILSGIYADKGRLDPDELEQEAREESHPLHGYLEWDDSEAARRYRVMEISKLIRSVHIVREVHTPRPRKVEVRAFYATHDDRRYVPIEVVESEPQTMATVREQMRRELADIRSKYRAQEALFLDVAHEVFELSA